MAFAGFSPGQAEGLRRAMSRKSSVEALGAFHDDFVEGARVTRGAGAEVAERVWSMIVGFSGFGFPKAHGAAFGLLAYQSTWLRVHYGPEFLCSLLDEQPMGFYPPDALVHDAQRRGIEVLAPDVNHSAVGCTVTAEGGRAHRPGLRPGRARRRGRRARGGAFRRVARSRRLGTRLAGRRRAPGAGDAGMVGRLRCARRRRPAPRAVDTGDRRARAQGRGTRAGHLTGGDAARGRPRDAGRGPPRRGVGSCPQQTRQGSRGYASAAGRPPRRRGSGREGEGRSSRSRWSCPPRRRSSASTAGRR